MNAVETKSKFGAKTVDETCILYPPFWMPFNFLCWDTDIPEMLEDQLGGFDGWPAELKNLIDSSPDKFLSPPTDWVSCVDPDNIDECTLQWAKESNAFTCSHVYPYPDGDICSGDYVQGAFPIIETQVARGILSRMHVYSNGRWIEACSIFEFGCYGPAWVGWKWKHGFQGSVAIIASCFIYPV